MAMTADSSSNHHSPSSGGDGGNSPHVRRKHLPSPWAQVVRGELEPSPAANQPQSPPPQLSTSPPAPAAAPEQGSSSPPLQADGVHVGAESSESEANSSNAASARPKKPAWSKPPPGDGSTATTADAGPLMGDAVSWPELSKAARPVPRAGAPDSSSPPPSRTVTEGSNSNSQAPAAVTNPPRRQAHSTNNPNPNPTPHPTVPARQRPNKQRGGGGGSGHPPPVQPIPPPPPPPPFPLFSVPPPNPYPNLLSPGTGPSVREHSANWEGSRPLGRFPSQPRPINEHRNFSRRGSFGSHTRGEGQRDRGNYGSGRDVNAQSHRANSRSYMRSPPPPPPPNPPPFLHPPPPGRPFMTPVPYTDMGPLYYPPVPMDPFRGGMLFANGPPLPVFYPVTEPHPLPVSLVRQIEYYFSDDNLAKDEFLKSNMDSEGWVPISLIAGFPRVKTMTTDAQLILNCLKASTLVEVQDEKVRRRNEWMKWVRAPGQFSSEGGSPSFAGSSQNTLAASLQNMAMVEAAADSSSTSPPVHPEEQNIGNTDSSHS
ncbi:la-related protein 1C-like [Punica granatum]|uniref:HTH La-type RNA-binding domain-containing protein n=2 Tax=Punica granatum TaxID=22663 RepID=A0A218WSL3_PUNGR|nr:la-related protein 1C-like [Punica granatum]OWM74962.1 hypothetical protein CDL15_Pgr021313 [Punica granatum]PKI75164.1 hypothetical protein CRG98_004499 [Punica granatum]